MLEVVGGEDESGGGGADLLGVVDDEADFLPKVGGALIGGELDVEVGGAVAGEAEVFEQGDACLFVAVVFAAFPGGSAGDDARQGGSLDESGEVVGTVGEGVDAELEQVGAELSGAGGIGDGLFEVEYRDGGGQLGHRRQRSDWTESCRAFPLCLGESSLPGVERDRVPQVFPPVIIMPQIQPIPAVLFRSSSDNEDISDRIAPPYDVLDESSKSALVAGNERNIVAIDLPYLPPKTVGPDEVYVEAGERYRRWLDEGVLVRRQTPAFFVYQQTYTVEGREYKRRGLIGNVQVQPFGPSPTGEGGGIYPHEQTFSSAKEDRLKLMRATKAQLSPIFGLYSDPDDVVGPMMDKVIHRRRADQYGRTADGVLHETWFVDRSDDVEAFQAVLGDKDIFIADGHHRYNTALNYQKEVGEGAGADYCLFVLVSMQDPGMIVLPTHRVLGNMPTFDFDAFVEASRGKLNVEPVLGTDLAALEEALESYAHPHAIGLYNPGDPSAPLAIATTVEKDPLASTHPKQSEAWRQLDVAIVQHLIVEQICQPSFCAAGEKVSWKFPHDLSELKTVADGSDYQLGLVLRPTPLDAVRQVSEAGELMPQKSTFFYPKLATGLAVNPLD